VKRRQRVAEVTAINQVQLRSLPPGTTPPFVIQYNASSVPVLQLDLRDEGSTSSSYPTWETNHPHAACHGRGRANALSYGGKQRQMRWTSI